MADKFQLKAIISAVDKLTPTLTGIRKAAKITKKSLGDIANASGTLMKSVGVSTAAVSAGVFAAVKKIVDVSAEFERFETILTTVEGSSEKAKESMQWVEQFAKKTPYELSEVLDSFVKMRAYGIDPTAGSLAAAGDAAAAMGKPVMQAVEALADAMTGENERLKEFGIRASKTGDTIRYTWSENGKTMVAQAKASSREQIEAVIGGIWNRRFSGAMDNLAGTWSGMWSNMLDTVTIFIRRIGASGFFDAIKKQLSGFMATIEQMEKDGTLKKLADQISADLVSGLKELVTWVASVDWRAFFTGVKDTIVQIKDFIKAIGGVKTVLIAFGLTLLAAPLAAIFTIIGAIWRLRLAYVALGAEATKSGAAMSTAMGASAAKSLTSQLGTLAKNAGLLTAAFGVGYAIGTAINSALSEKTRDKIGETVAKALAMFGNDDAEAALQQNGISRKKATTDTIMNLGKMVPGVGAAYQLADLVRSNKPDIAGDHRTQVKGEMVVKFENAPPQMRVSPGKTNQSGFELNPDVGYNPLRVFGM